MDQGVLCGHWCVGNPMHQWYCRKGHEQLVDTRTYLMLAKAEQEFWETLNTGKRYAIDRKKQPPLQCLNKSCCFSPDPELLTGERFSYPYFSELQRLTWGDQHWSFYLESWFANLIRLTLLFEKRFEANVVGMRIVTSVPVPEHPDGLPLSEGMVYQERFDLRQNSVDLTDYLDRCAMIFDCYCAQKLQPILELRGKIESASSP